MINYIFKIEIMLFYLVDAVFFRDKLKRINMYARAKIRTQISLLRERMR